MKKEPLYSLDWLPGYKEMMACQETMMPGDLAEQNEEAVDRTGEDTREMPAPEENASARMANGYGTEPWERVRYDRQMPGPGGGYFSGEDREPDIMPGQRMTPEQGVMPDERMTPGASGENQEEMLPPERLQREEQEYWKDYDYFVRLLPLAAREIWAAVDAILDRYEFCESSMYAEFPDKTAIQRIADQVYDKMKYYEENRMMNRMDGMEAANPYYMSEENRSMDTPLKNLIFVIISFNMLYRRQRYCRRKKVFPLSV